MRNTLRALDFFTSSHLTIFGRPAFDKFFDSQLTQAIHKKRKKSCSQVYGALPDENFGRRGWGPEEGEIPFYKGGFTFPRFSSN
jgi:hypothetical protein